MLNKIFSWYFSRNSLPYWCILAMDSFLLFVSWMVSVYLANGGGYLASHFWTYVRLGFWFMPCVWIFMRVFHTYSGIFRYSSFVDLARACMAVLLGIGFFAVGYECVHRVFGLEDFLRIRMLFSTFFISITFICGTRILVKYLYDQIVSHGATRRALIYGVREGGLSLAKSIRSEHPARYSVHGFVTDDVTMKGVYLLGCKVYMDNMEIQKAIEKHHIRDIFVSPIAVDSFRANEELLSILTKGHVRILMMDSAKRWDGKSEINYQQLREVDIEDLLPRDQINVDLDAIGEMLKGKRILITGAAGSIGSEMVRQVAQFSPSELIMVDQAETPMHDIRLYMGSHHPELNACTIVGSICNESQMEQIFSEHRPQYVFHAAAYKHVPMMEDNPAMAIQNNCYGTRVIADLAVKYGTMKFVMISTDKAVNPTNVMGCSKRICEIYCQSLNAAIASGKCPEALLPEDGKACTQFITTRFGNVLGSNGSVIPIFRKQIKAGGPITVTHPDIIRFFMLIPEACQLVLEAGTMGRGGEIFVFDMGKPVRIADLAQRMIDLSGAKGVEIKYTGLRDGEKLFEEVLNDAEQTKPTVHPKIKVAAVREYPYEEARQQEAELYKLSFTYDDMAIVARMKQIVPEYKSQVSKYEVLDK